MQCCFADEMRDGKIDAIFNGALIASPDYTKWAPLPALAELLAMDDVNLYPLMKIFFMSQWLTLVCLLFRGR